MPDQASFRAALLNATHPVPDGLLDGHGRAAGRRYSVYRNNVAVSLTEALQDSFPILRKLLGDQNFAGLAGIYLRAHPPKSPLMMHYGTDMPGFLDAFQPLAHIGYLADVARLENALRDSYHAADAQPLPAERLAGLAPDVLATARLHLAPSLRLVRSRWPLFDIWRFNTTEGASKPQSIAQSVLITRAEFDPEPHPLSCAETAALRAILQGGTLTHAVTEAEAESPDFDISPLLGRLVSQNAITDLTTT